jgi:hypothetical protein
MKRSAGALRTVEGITSTEVVITSPSSSPLGLYR